MDYRTMTVNPWKTVLFVFVVCALGFSAAAEEKGLVAYYPFEEGKGAIAHDSSGHNNNGRIIGARWVKGPYGKALSFDGVDDFVDCGSNESLRIESAASVAFWFKPTVCQGGLVNWSVGRTWRDQRLVLSFTDREEFCVYMSDDKAHTGRRHLDTVMYKSGFPPVDVWTHFAMTFDGRSVSIYKDGAHVDIKSPEFQPHLEDVPMWIGKSLGLGESYFNGLIDEVRIYNREISDKRVIELYKADAEKRGKDTKRFNKALVEATAYPIQGSIVANLDFHEMWPTPEGMSIEADLLDVAGATVMKGKVDMLPVWGLAEAHFNAPSLAIRTSERRPVAFSISTMGRGKTSLWGLTTTS